MTIHKIKLLLMINNTMIMMKKHLRTFKYKVLPMYAMATSFVPNLLYNKKSSHLMLRVKQGRITLTLILDKYLLNFKISLINLISSLSNSNNLIVNLIMIKQEQQNKFLSLKINYLEIVHHN